MVNKKIFEKVNYCLEKYVGGEIFFDELDNMVKFDKEVLKEFISLVKKKCEFTKDFRTIASGEFGLCLHNYKLPVDILAQGGLRKGVKISDLSPFVEKGKIYFFLDDSYFSGKTAQVIKEEIERCGGVFGGCFVIYDGSQKPLHLVDSIYRYYDNYDILGRKKKD